jgi:UrcA family protein
MMRHGMWTGLKETIVILSATSIGLRGLIASAILAVSGPGLCSVAAADPGAESRTVKFADLDLSRAAGAHALYRRIRAAAQVACSHYFFATDTDREHCVREATADAVTRINRPALSAVYDSNNR